MDKIGCINRPTRNWRNMHGPNTTLSADYDRSASGKGAIMLPYDSIRTVHRHWTCISILFNQPFSVIDLDNVRYFRECPPFCDLALHLRPTFLLLMQSGPCRSCRSQEDLKSGSIPQQLHE